MAEAAADIPSLAGQRALVTGGHGFIGTRLCRRLESLGAEVYPLSRTRHEDAGALACDLSSGERTREMFHRTRPDLVFHLASHVAGNRSVDVVPSTFHSNLTSTMNLLVAAHESGCRRVILTGSLEEPDPGPEWPVPSSPYAAAKFAAGTYGRMFHALFGVPVVILRVFMVYGPGQRDTRKLVPYVITSLLDGAVPRLTSGARPVDWIYVDDVVEAFVAAAVSPSAPGATLDAGSGTLVTVREVVETLFRLVGAPHPPVFGQVPDRPLEQVRAADVERTRTLTGWAPRTGLDEGLAETVCWYRQQR